MSELHDGKATFSDLVYGVFTLTDRDIALDKLAGRYHTDCETYDKTVCSLTNKQGTAMSSNGNQLLLINKNALSVKRRLVKEYESWCFTGKEIKNAISKWRG